MSTRGVIAIKDESGYVCGIYCHSDAYLDYTGVRLLENYNTEEKICELIKHGSASHIGKVIGVQHDFNDYEWWYEDETHEEQCKFYHRDRGDDLEMYSANSEEKFFKRYTESVDYIFKDGQWYVRTFELDEDDEFIPLTEALEQLKEQREKEKEEESD